MKLIDFILDQIGEEPISGDDLYKKIESILSDGQFVTMDRVQDVLDQLEARGDVHLAKGKWNLGKKPNEAEVVVNNEKQEPVLTPESRQRWKDFRRLLAYYIECVRYDEKASYKLYGDQINKQWLPIAMYRDWFQNKTEDLLEIPLSDNHSKFVLNVLSQKAEQLFVSYPLEVVKTPQYQFVVPIYCIPVSTLKLEGQNLKLELDYDSVDVNSDWLEHSCPNRDARENFLKVSGLRDPGGVDLEDELEDEDTVTDYSDILDFDIERLTSALKTFQGENLDGRALDPGMINPLPPVSSLDSGIYNGMVLFSGKKLKYTASLVRELRRLQNYARDEEFEQSALRHIFFPTADLPDAEIIPSIFPVLDLTQSQFKAACNTSTEDLSVVTGPPGTGKSQVVSVALASSLLRGETAVFASKNHRALDAVTPRLNSLSDNLPVIRRQKEMEVSEHSWKKLIDDILANPSVDESILTELESRKKFCIGLSEELAEIIQEYEVLVKSGQESDTLFWRKKEILSQRGYAGLDLPSLQSKNVTKHLRKFSRHARVLENLVAQPVSQWQFLKRFLKKRRLAKLENLTEAILGKLNAPADFFSIGANKVSKNANKAELLANDLEELESIESQQKPLSMDKLPELRDKCKEVIQELKTVAIDTLRMHLKVGLSTFGDDERKTLSSAKVILKQLEDASSPQELGRLSSQLTWTFETLMTKTPLLAVTNLSAMKMFPSSQPAQFDLLVVDEASQSDIPSTIPLLFRTKRLSVIGDPKQLRAVHPMKASMHEHIKRKLSLNSPRFAPYDYLESSFFDLASHFAGNSRRTRLVEHFRCHSQIADYCNDVSYSNELSVITDEQRLRGDYKGRRGLHWTEVAGSCKRDSGGGSKCHEEAEVVVEIIKETLNSSNDQFTIGVVTPFRAQANLIKSMLEKVLEPRHWLERDLLIETADGFQGDERDVIIFSVACQPNMHRGSLWFISQEQNRWNVAVSRARALLHVVGNREFCLNSNILHVRRLAEHSKYKNSTKDKLFESIWEERFYNALKKASIDTVPQHPVAGYRFDLAIPNKKLDIEVDGKKYHLDEYGKRKSSDIWRDMTVENLGWRVKRFWVQELSDDMDACVDEIRTLCQSDL